MDKDKKVVPNWNTVSTIIDRISIESVKKAHFLDVLDNDGVPKDERLEAQLAIEVQDSILRSLREEFADLVVDLLRSGTYEYLVEQRTFK